MCIPLTGILLTGIHANEARLSASHAFQESYVPGRKADLVADDGTHLAAFCKMPHTESSSSTPASMYRLMPPRDMQPADSFSLTFRNGDVYTCSRTYPDLHGSIAKISPGALTPHLECTRRAASSVEMKLEWPVPEPAQGTVSVR